MPTDRKTVRVFVLVEDSRTQRFFWNLLCELGFHPRRIRVEHAPSEKGAAEGWVRKRYPGEVKALRSKSFQKNVALIAVRDADGNSLAQRKRELDKALTDAGLDCRQTDEAISVSVPARNVETWLLALLGDSGVNETEDFKHRFQHAHGGDEGLASKTAAKAWRSFAISSLPSLADGKIEIARLVP